MKNQVVVWQSAGSDGLIEQLEKAADNAGTDPHNQKSGVFTGSSLNISGVALRSLRIQSHPSVSEKIRIKAIFEDRSEFDRLRVSEGDTIEITQIPDAQSGGGTSFNNVFGNVFNNVVINNIVSVDGRIVSGSSSGSGRSKPATLVLLIIVPPGCPLTIDASGSTDIEIGDVGGAMELELTGKNRVSIETAASLSLEIGGLGTVSVGSVTGDLRVEQTGKASVDVQAGDVDKLNLNLSGQGNFSFGGTAKRASINASGMCNVQINRVTEKLKTNGSGMCTISVTHKP